MEAEDRIRVQCKDGGWYLIPPDEVKQFREWDADEINGMLGRPTYFGRDYNGCYIGDEG